MRRKSLITITLILFCFISFIFSIEPNSNNETKLSPQELLKILPPLLTNQLYVGYSKKCTDPQEGPMPLSGLGNSRSRLADVKNQPYKLSLYETLILLMDKHGSISILITIDLLHAWEPPTNKIKTEIESKFGIPKENITISATHTHNAPDLLITDMSPVVKYIDFLKTTIVESVKEALEDLTPAYAYVGTVKVELENGMNALNFVRHYHTKNFDKFGNPVYFGANHGTYGWNGTSFINVQRTNHTTIADNELQLIKFDFGFFNKPDVILANFRAHCTITSGAAITVISSDWVAGFRDNLEKNKTCRVAYFNGASGDNVPDTYLNIGEGIPGITHQYKADPSKDNNEILRDRALAHGKALSEYAIKIYNNKDLKQVRLGDITHSNTTVKLFYAIYKGDIVTNSNYMNKFWNIQNDILKQMICGTYSWEDGFQFPKEFDKTGKKLRQIIRENYHLLKDYITVSDEGKTCQVNFINSSPTSIQSFLNKFIGNQFEFIIQSIYHAIRIIANSKYNEDDYKDVKISAINIGDISFAAAPYEMFHSNGKFIKDEAKTKMTFILTNANGGEGYIPSNYAFEYGCYETDTCQFRKGCGESLANGFIKIINDNYQYNFGGKYLGKINNIWITFIISLFLFI